MKLLTKDIHEQLLLNGKKSREAQNENKVFDPFPVVKLFTPDGSATWLLAWIEPDNPDIAYGLCDLGMGCPELGTVRISELKQLRGKLGLPVERDKFFTPRVRLRELAKIVRRSSIAGI